MTHSTEDLCSGSCTMAGFRIPGDQHIERQSAILRAALDNVAGLDEQRWCCPGCPPASCGAAGFVHDDAAVFDAFLQCYDVQVLCLIFAVNEEHGEVAMRMRAGDGVILDGHDGAAHLRQFGGLKSRGRFPRGSVSPIG